MNRFTRLMLAGLMTLLVAAASIAVAGPRLFHASTAVVLPTAVPPTDVAERYPGLLFGYLEPDAMPDGLNIVPEVPPQGSEQAQQDEIRNQQHLALQGTKRWAWAAKDADLDFPTASTIFSCAANIVVDAEAMPHLVMLLRRSLTDFGLSTSAVKKHYQRPRPFLSNEHAICIPEELNGLKPSGSYPSGHAAIGWGWALLFAQLVPNRTTEIMARGRAFGDSRAICNVHWQSDVVAGRTMAVAVFDNLRANAIFNAEIALAQAEIDNAVKKLPVDQCHEESQALGIPF